MRSLEGTARTHRDRAAMEIAIAGNNLHCIRVYPFDLGAPLARGFDRYLHRFETGVGG